MTRTGDDAQKITGTVDVVQKILVTVDDAQKITGTFDVAKKISLNSVYSV